MEEKILIKNARNGDENSLNELMENYKRLVSKISRKYFIIGAELNDVIQEGMIGLFNAITNYDENKNASFKTFAVLCINRQIQTAIKKAYKHSKSDLIDDINFDMLSKHLNIVSPEDDFIEIESYNYLKNEIKNKLSKKEYDILQKFLENKSYDEIAQELETTKKSVDNALSRIRNKLKYLNKLL